MTICVRSRRTCRTRWKLSSTGSANCGRRSTVLFMGGAGGSPRGRDRNPVHLTLGSAAAHPRHHGRCGLCLAWRDHRDGRCDADARQSFGHVPTRRSSRRSNSPWRGRMLNSADIPGMSRRSTTFCPNFRKQRAADLAPIILGHSQNAGPSEYNVGCRSHPTISSVRRKFCRCSADGCT